MTIRNSQLAKIHIARKDLAMTDDSYRALLERVTGHSSSKDLNQPERLLVLAEFKRLGWQPEARKKSVKEDWRAPRIRKITKLWFLLHEAGEVRNKSRQAMNQFCKSQTNIDKPEWMTSPQLNQCVEALNSWHQRSLNKSRKSTKA